METCYELETFRVKLIVSDRPAEKCDSYNAVNILRLIYADLDADQEHFTAVFLDQKNQIRGYKVLFTGSQTASIVTPSVVFRAAILFGAIGIVIAHNHPSGDPTPSWEDKDLTRRLKESAEILCVRFLDHIVLGEGSRWYSFSEAEDEERAEEMRNWKRERERKREERAARRLAKRATVEAPKPE